MKLRRRVQRQQPLARGRGLLRNVNRQRELVKSDTIVRVAKRVVQGQVLGGLDEAGPKAGHYGAMRRAFKGIMPRSEAMHMRLAAERQQRRQARAA